MLRSDKAVIEGKQYLKDVRMLVTLLSEDNFLQVRAHTLRLREKLLVNFSSLPQICARVIHCQEVHSK